jgi:hypothetical protein
MRAYRKHMTDLFGQHMQQVEFERGLVPQAAP